MSKTKTEWKPKGESYTDNQGNQWRWHTGKKEYVRNYGTSPAAYVDRKARQALTGVVDTYKRVGTSALDKWNTKLENRKSMMIGGGSEDNPEFITNKRGTKIKNPNYKPPTFQNRARGGDGTTNGYVSGDTGLYMVNGQLQPKGSDVGLGVDPASLDGVQPLSASQATATDQAVEVTTPNPERQSLAIGPGDITPDQLGGRLPAGMSIKEFNRARRANQVTETNKGYFVSTTSGSRKFVPKPTPLQTKQVYVK